MSTLSIPTQNNKSFDSYICFPPTLKEGQTAPCVIVIQEIFGINKVIRDKCHWLAQEGFIACAPDLFHQFEPGIELSDHNEEDLNRAFDLFGKFNIDQGIKDIQATQNTLRDHPQNNGHVGAVGYCLGGKLAYLTACHTQSDATVGYYGVGIEELLADANNIKSNLMLHIAQEDEFVPKEAQTKIHEGLSGHEKITLHSYENVSHAFSREGGDNYNETAAELADKRTIEFLKNNLI